MHLGRYGHWVTGTEDWCKQLEPRIGIGTGDQGHLSAGRMAFNALCLLGWPHENSWALAGGTPPASVSSAVMAVLVRTDFKA